MQCGSKRSGKDLRNTFISGCRNGSIKKWNVRVLVALFIIFLISVNCHPLTFGTSFAIRSPKNDSEPIDYEIGSNVEVDSLMSLDVEFERQDGKYYRDLELFVWRWYKFLQFSGKYINIEEDNLTNISVDTRLKHKSHTLGIAQTWDLRPQTMLVVGEDIRWKFGIPLLTPIEFRGITNFYTSNFRKFNNETEIKFTGKLSSILSIYYRYKSRYYDNWNFSMKIGIEVKI